MDVMYAAVRAGARALAAAALLSGAAHATPVGVHDPVMAKEGSRYCVFSTGPGIAFYSSADMLQSAPGRDNWNAIDPNAVEDEQAAGWMRFGSFRGGIALVNLRWLRLDGAARLRDRRTRQAEAEGA